MTRIYARSNGCGIGIVEMYAMRVSLEYAALFVDPDEYSYRTTLKHLMPKLSEMRQRGMSFPEIRDTLYQAGFPIALRTLRAYYNEFRANRSGKRRG